MIERIKLEILDDLNNTDTFGDGEPSWVPEQELDVVSCKEYSLEDTRTAIRNLVHDDLIKYDIEEGLFIITKSGISFIHDYHARQS